MLLRALYLVIIQFEMFHFFLFYVPHSCIHKMPIFLIKIPNLSDELKIKQMHL